MQQNPPTTITAINRRLSTAPMMRYSHIHARQLWRQLCPNALLYTEMYPATAIIRRPELIQHEAQQNPVALQIAGNNPLELAQAAKLGQQAGFAEINLNCGCPSPTVTSGGFGACLMATPELVAKCITIIKREIELPVTVKCRTGIKDKLLAADLYKFASLVTNAGVNTLIVHARDAWLTGIDPKSNRTRPPLNYEKVFALKQAMPDLQITINGQIADVTTAKMVLDKVDGVMIGRAVTKQTAVLIELSEQLQATSVSLATALGDYLDYCESKMTTKVNVLQLFSPLAGLFAGVPGSAKIRKVIASVGKLDTNPAVQIRTVIAQLTETT